MRVLSVATPVLALCLAACDESAKPAAPAPGVDAATRFPIAIGASSLKVRLALTELEQTTGLMTTKALPKDEGMLFAYREPRRLAFWMKNVPYDIDIGYFDTTGRLDEVARLRAEDLEPVDTKSENIRYAVEAPAGWYADHGVRPGAKLDLAALARAIRDRGFPEKDFADAK